MIAELQNKRTELLTKFNADDRLVKEVDEQIANTQAALTNATVIVATEEATDINPTWQKLQIAAHGRRAAARWSAQPGRAAADADRRIPLARRLARRGNAGL